MDTLEAFLIAHWAAVMWTIFGSAGAFISIMFAHLIYLDFTCPAYPYVPDYPGDRVYKVKKIKKRGSGAKKAA